MTSILTSGGGGEGGDFLYIYIHIYISSFKLLIVCLDYQNHSSALLAAVRPTCLPPRPAPLKPTMQPTRRLWRCPWAPEAPAPRSTGVFHHRVPCCFTYPSATSGGRKPKDLRVGVGEFQPLLPSPLSPAQRRCSHQKRLLKDDSFYFFFL